MTLAFMSWAISFRAQKSVKINGSAPGKASKKLTCWGQGEIPEEMHRCIRCTGQELRRKRAFGLDLNGEVHDSWARSQSYIPGGGQSGGPSKGSETQWAERQKDTRTNWSLRIVEIRVTCEKVCKWQIRAHWTWHWSLVAFNRDASEVVSTA